MTIRCLKCHRPMKQATESGFGPKCAAAIAKAQEDARQAQLFPRSLLSHGARLWDGFVRAVFGEQSV
jgi:hypothetical protein